MVVLKLQLRLPLDEPECMNQELHQLGKLDEQVPVLYQTPFFRL
jgi:hypothetical protein